MTANRHRGGMGAGMGLLGTLLAVAITAGIWFYYSGNAIKTGNEAKTQIDQVNKAKSLVDSINKNTQQQNETIEQGTTAPAATSRP